MSRIRIVLFTLLCMALSGAAHASFHIVQISKAFSNADGTVQFIQIDALAGGQQFVGGHTIVSSQNGVTKTFTFGGNLPGDTTGRKFLIGTSGFAALGILTPDYIMPNGFMFTGNGTITYGEGTDLMSWTSLPTDGHLMLVRGGGTAANSATNFAGSSASVNLAAAVVDYTGAWYDPVQSGWGLSVVKGASGAYGIIMYHYTPAHAPIWYFMSGGSFAGTVYSAPVQQFTGSWFGEPFGTVGTAATGVGTATINFTSDTAATLSYTINGVQVTRNIVKLAF